MERKEELSLEIDAMENLKLGGALSESGLEVLEEKKRELKELELKTIILKEGEEIKIKAENGTSEAYAIMVCYCNCILKRSEVRALKNKKS